MAHPASILFFLGLLIGLLALLERIVRDNGPAIRHALWGTRTRAASNESALDLVGSCLRASFQSRDQEKLGPELGRLLGQLAGESPSRARHA